MTDISLTVKMIEAAINKGIRDIEDDPKRGIRNLVDLANHFANGPFQKDILILMQAMLADLNSPYYHIVLDLINSVNHNTIKRFGINLGYYSWTHGAKKIREHKEIYNYNVPWTIIFDFKEENNDTLGVHKVLDIIREGKEMGIYTYLFFVNKIDDFSSIAKENLDCAFAIFTSPNSLTEKNVSKIQPYNNTVFLILCETLSNPSILKDTIRLLKDNKSLFGLYDYYEDENIKYILEDKWTDKIINNKAPFGILIDSKNCNKKNASLINDYVFNSKTNQEHSTFLIDLYEDISRINRNISQSSCIFTIQGNGEIKFYRSFKKEKYNIRNMSLKKILSKTY